jgi:hypothetical protein
MDWINLAQYTDRQRVSVSVVMNLRVAQNSGISRLGKDLSASRGLCSI